MTFPIPLPDVFASVFVLACQTAQLYRVGFSHLSSLALASPGRETVDIAAQLVPFLWQET